jgi:beta-galactosidase
MKIKNLVSWFIIILCSLICLSGMTGKSEKINELKVNKNGRTSILFDSSWRFHLGDMQDAEKHDFDDSSWRTIDLPHDWSIEDITGTNAPVDSNAIGGSSTGYMVGGTGWYRKTFYVGNDINGKCIRIQFDGIYMIADIWINGISLGTHPYGYTSFSYDLTSKLEAGKLNTLAVKVRNEGRNTRWYSGSGIYRHIWITATGQLHFDHWGTCITTPEVVGDHARVNVKTSIMNEFPD